MRVGVGVRVGSVLVRMRMRMRAGRRDAALCRFVVGALRHVAVRAGRVEQLRRQEPVLGLQQLALLFAFLLLEALQLAPCDLFRVHGLAAARGGVRVVRRSTGTFLRVLLLPPFGSPILKPDLQPTTTTTML